MLTPKDVALACDVTYETALRWIRERGLPARRRGFSGSYRIEPAAFLQWCADNDVHVYNPFLERVAE